MQASSSITPPIDTSPASHPRNKPCTLCGTPKPVLVRCQIDESEIWHFVCPGACWKSVSGGVEDAKGLEGEFPFYRYGGMWKNKYAGVSAKKPKSKLKARPLPDDPESDIPKRSTAILPPSRRQWLPDTAYTRNDQVLYNDKVWICRRSHLSRRPVQVKDDTGDGNSPTDLKGYRYWKEDDEFSKDYTADESGDDARDGEGSHG